MPLDPKLAPTLVGNYTVTSSISVKLRPAQNGYNQPQFNLLVIEQNGQPTMVIDELGTGRFIRKRENQAFPYDKYVYLNARKYHLSLPLEQPFSRIVAMYEEALKTLEKKAVPA